MGEPCVKSTAWPRRGHSRAPLVDVLEEDLSQFMGRAKAATLTDDDALEEGLRKVARQSTQTEIGKRPEVTVIIQPAVLPRAEIRHVPCRGMTRRPCAAFVSWRKREGDRCLTQRS